MAVAGDAKNFGALDGLVGEGAIRDLKNAADDPSSRRRKRGPKRITCCICLRAGRATLVLFLKIDIFSFLRNRVQWLSHHGALAADCALMSSPIRCIQGTRKTRLQASQVSWQPRTGA